MDSVTPYLRLSFNPIAPIHVSYVCPDNIISSNALSALLLASLSKTCSHSALSISQKAKPRTLNGCPAYPAIFSIFSITVARSLAPNSADLPSAES